MSRPATLTQAELTRYAKAMRDAAVVEWRVIIHPDGRREIIAGSDPARPGPTGWEDLE